MFNKLKNILPEFPRTLHVPYKANMAVGDVLADNTSFLDSDDVQITEKIDGSNCGMCLYEGEAVIRNRTHILRKGYKKNTPAKEQFNSVWTWFYENKAKFQRINEFGPYSVYGEWLFALHGIRYNALPDYFIAFDLYDYENGYYVNPVLAYEILQQSGFLVPQVIHSGKTTFAKLEAYCEEPASYSSLDKREGLYIKTFDFKKVTGRYKMIRSDFKQGCHWNEEKLTKNQIVKNR